MVPMADRAWRGYWWLRGRPDEEVPGTLVQREADGAVVLNLIGGFSIEVLTPIDEHQSSVSFDGTFPMILGTSSGERFTLLECNATRTNGLLSISEQDIAVQRALRGIHLSDPDEKVFDSAQLTVEYLLGWTHSTTLEASAELNGWKWTGNQTATTKPIDDLPAVHGGYEYTLSVVSTSSGLRTGRAPTNVRWPTGSGRNSRSGRTLGPRSVASTGRRKRSWI